MLFERTFIDDKFLHEEIYNPYYHYSENADVCENILNDFGIDMSTGHIINGHVPVKIKDGESPVKANGKLFRNRRRNIKGISGGNGNCRIYIDIRFAQLKPCRAQVIYTGRSRAYAYGKDCRADEQTCKCCRYGYRKKSAGAD